MYKEWDRKSNRVTMLGYSWGKEDFRELLYHKYIPMEELENWCYGLWEKTTDYILTEWLLDSLPTLYPQDEIIFEYNQGKQTWSKQSCTLFSPIWAISDLMNIDIPLSTIKSWDDGSYNHGRKKGHWWLVQLGVDYITKCYNASDFAKEHGKVAYYSIDLRNDELVHKVLDKRYTICSWFNGNAAYQNDKNKDWILNWTEWWASTFWHAVNVIWWLTTPSRIKDNYVWTTKYNIYWVEHEFSEIPCYFEKGYVFTKVAEDYLEELKRLNEFRTNLVNWIEINSKMWHQTNDTNYQSILHYMNEKNRKKLQDIDEQVALIHNKI